MYIQTQARVHLPKKSSAVETTASKQWSGCSILNYDGLDELPRTNSSLRKKEREREREREKGREGEFIVYYQASCCLP